jgi:ribonuclease D
MRAMYRVVATDEQLQGVLPMFAAEPEVAVDTEFHPERSYRPRLMLIQVAVAGAAPLLIDPLGSIDLRPLGAALSAARLVVHGGSWDMVLLHQHCGLIPSRVSDTQLVAAFAGLGWPRRLQDLLDLVLGVHLSKGSTLSDWSRRPLSEAQAAYAAEDVALLGELDAALRDRVSELGNQEWLAAAEAELLPAYLNPVDPAAAWRRVPGAHLLDEAARRALCALATWRERKALETDQPLNHVVSDAILLDLARRRPATIDEIRENRRLPSSVWRGHGAAIVELVGDESLPIPAPLPRGVRVDIVRAAARSAAASKGMSGDLLLTDCEVEYILAESNSGSWRRAALGIEFVQFLEGRRFLDSHGRLVAP